MKILSSLPEITFDDVLLLPGKSNFSINEEKEKISLRTKISRTITLDIPLLSSPMPGITEAAMAVSMGQAGGLGVVHHFQSFDRQLKIISEVKKSRVKVAAAVADLSDRGIEHVSHLLQAGADLISLESAHAQNTEVISFVKKLKKRFLKIDISVALLVTAEGTEELIKAGADSIRVGIGGGSHCTTRLVTGIGRPQLSTVLACAKMTKKYNIPLISDTGIKYAGDIPKALAFGADAVMIGGLLSGTNECPGEIIMKNHQKYKYSWGMCTDIAMKHEQLSLLPTPRKIKTRMKHAFKNFFLSNQNPRDEKLFEEGVAGLIPYKGSVAPIIEELIDGTRRSMWYIGAHNISELQEKAKVVLVSHQTFQENIPRI